MKKTFYYNFLPTKAEEEAAIARKVLYQVTRTLVEIRDLSTPPCNDPNNPWQIRKAVTNTEVLSGKLELSHEITFEHIFRYWNLELANLVVQGTKCSVVIIDCTDDGMPKSFQDENIYVKKGTADTYVMGFKEVAVSRLLKSGDEIGLFLDMRSGGYGNIFAFKLLRRANPHILLVDPN